MKRLPLWLGAAWLCLNLTATAADSLDAGFLNPPDSAKPQTWWHWMNGNITKAGITADLEAMKRGGLGGATIVNADCDIPHGPVNFMSPEWRDDFKFAVSEANRLGLELCVENCAGWSSSGGPWNVASNAMQQITTSEIRVAGPRHFSGRLPPPPARLDFYRDIAVFAFPTPEGEAVDMKALVLKATTSAEGQDAGKLFDGSGDTFVTLPVPTNGRPQFVQLEFAQPFVTRLITLTLGSGAREWGAGQCEGVIQTSDDGVAFHDLRKFSFPDRAFNPVTLSLGNSPVSARFYRALFTSAGDQVKEIPVAEFQLSPRLGIENVDAKAGFNDNGTSSPVPASVAPALVVNHSGMKNLTRRLKPDGRLDWDVPAGNWTILRMGFTPTGVNNHPAPVEGTGLECDKLSKEALDAHWAGMMKPVLDDVGPLAGKSLTGSLIDSYEVGGQNWTPKFRGEFQKRRGYDPLPFLPTFTGRVVDSPDVSERFLWDVRRTIADLFDENYYGHFQTLCHQAGLAAYTEPYGGPFESLQAGAAADIPMGEFWIGQPWVNAKLPASIGHIYGRKFIGAESFTAMPGEHGRWLEDPYSLKMLGDSVFCQGVNRYFFHRFAMQPWTNRWPGMTMGQWGSHFDRTSTWWEPGSAWRQYISRCEYILQQGRFVADAAYFCGESAPVEFPVGNPALPAGYDYDGVNADVLKTAAVQQGQLVLKSGMSYHVLILPPAERAMTPALLRRLRGLVAAGLTLVGAPPTSSPSLAGYPRCDAEVKSLVAEMWGQADGRKVTENNFGKGKVIWGQPLDRVLAGLSVKPDFTFAANDGIKLAYIHRRDGDAEIYFVSNQRRQADTADCSFRVSGKTPELWHPDSGVIERAPVWHEQDGRTTVRLTFDPAGSVFVVFRAAANGDQIANAKMDSEWQTQSGANGELRVKAASDGTATFTTVAGKTLQAVAANVPAPLELTGAWTLNFPPHWGAPPSVTLGKLISWTEHPDNGVRYFSGTATYEKEIEISADRLLAGRELWLDLGAVKNIAEVSLNGRNLGVLWKPPFRVDLTAAAKPGVNQLEVKVTNLWPNRLIGDEQLPPDCEWDGKRLKAWPQWLLDGKPSPTGRLTFTTWHHWTKDSALLESGLLGPVTLRTVEIISTR